jgi:hypothetical protein
MDLLLRRLGCPACFLYASGRRRKKKEIRPLKKNKENVLYLYRPAKPLSTQVETSSHKPQVQVHNNHKSQITDRR